MMVAFAWQDRSNDFLACLFMVETSGGVQVGLDGSLVEGFFSCSRGGELLSINFQFVLVDQEGDCLVDRDGGDFVTFVVV